MKSLVLAGLMVYACGALCACGQKGPLVLPDTPKRKHTIPTLPNTATPKGSGATAPAEPSPATGPAATPASPAAPRQP